MFFKLISPRPCAPGAALKLFCRLLMLALLLGRPFPAMAGVAAQGWPAHSAAGTASLRAPALNLAGHALPPMPATGLAELAPENIWGGAFWAGSDRLFAGASAGAADGPPAAGPELPEAAVEPPAHVSIYDRPYSLWENDINGPALKRNTLLLFGSGIAAMGILALMPTSVTNWDDDAGKDPFGKWWKNVTHGPVWDRDDWWLNYITHPWAGAIYYMGARSSGANAMYSFGYAFALSTFFWECGIESFAEIPSLQDLIVTPVAGAILGEGFYLAKRHIVENDYRLLNSRILGVTAALLMDPLSEVSGFIFDDATKKRDLIVYGAPLISSQGKLGYQVSFSYSF